ncbi:MAG TPA: CarD family transcriptional regulator [Spirochaetota bacterium]
MSKEKEKDKVYHFKVGDKVVYPMHGVGAIDSIEKKEVLGQKAEFYIIRIVNNGMKVMIPVKNAITVGIRSVIGKNEVKKVLELLKRTDVKIEEDWKLRYENNVNKVKSGNILEVGEVARDLFRRGREKELSIMERKLYESAYNLLIHEIAMSKSVDIEEAGNIVSEALSVSE